MNLESLGAGAFVSSAFSPYGPQGLILGRVAIANRNQYRLYIAAGEIAAEPSGTLLYRSADPASLPVTGDWVAVRVLEPSKGIVEAVLPRGSCFLRRAAGRREERQAVAANIDTVFLVCGLDDDFNMRRLERYLVLAADSGAEPVVVLNKADLCQDISGRVADAFAAASGVPVIPVSALAGEGIAPLKLFVKSGRTVALLGSSGVGKSTIVNALLGNSRFKTGEVRESDGRGRHTTTHRELVPLPGGGALIDTPGMRELQLWASEECVDEVFGEIASLAPHCRFADCAHAAEPGCAVRAALATGQITTERWTSYRKLRGEARRHEAIEDPRAAQRDKQNIKRIMKAQRQFNKFKKT